VAFYLDSLFIIPKSWEHDVFTEEGMFLWKMTF